MHDGRMPKTVVLVGALDTKGPDFEYVRGRITAQGLATLVVDFGVIGPPTLAPDVPRDEVLAAAGLDAERLASGRHKDEAMRGMADGLATVVRRLYDAGRLDGILGMGGSSGTSIATAAMRALPIGVPKVMVSTVAGGDIGPYVGTRDITFMPSIGDIAGLNRLSRRILANAAAAIAGMVLADEPAIDAARPMIVASMFGNTTPAVERARAGLEAAGYEVVVFHAVGSGGRAMEELIAEGWAAASLDITTTELADEVCGGIMSAGPDRCRAASRAGIPAVLVPGCVDMVNFGVPESVPERYAERTLYRWNPNTTLMRTTVEENLRIGRMLAAAANAATGPVAILLPLRGLSMLDAADHPFWDPEADGACFAAIRAAVRPDVPVHDVDAHINEPAFADRAVAELLALLERSR
jgi:uncharacterized protein (UPF0261 family)